MMVLFIIGLYLGVGVGITLVRGEFYDFEDFIMETLAWPMVIIEPIMDIISDGVDWFFDAIDDFFSAIWDQFEGILDWLYDNTIGRFDGNQTIRSGKDSINIQTNGDLDITGDLDGNINIQTHGRALRKKKKVEVRELTEADLLKKNPLE